MGVTAFYIIRIPLRVDMASGVRKTAEKAGALLTGVLNDGLRGCTCSSRSIEPQIAQVESVSADRSSGWGKLTPKRPKNEGKRQAKTKKRRNCHGCMEK